MKKYTVEITVTCKKEVDINAESWPEARNKVQKNFYRGDVNIGREDFLDAEFEVIKERSIYRKDER